MYKRQPNIQVIKFITEYMFCNNTKSDINTNVVPLIDGGTDDLYFGPEIEPGTEP